jgi:hypothetical protein
MPKTPKKNHTELIIDDPLNKIVGEKLQFISVGLDYGTGLQDSKLGKTVLSAVAFTKGFKKAYCIAESYFDGFFLPDRITAWVIDFLLELKSNFKLDLTLHAEWASSAALNNAVRYELMNRGIEGVTVENAYKSTILDRIDLCQILLGERRLLFTSKTPGVKKGFSTALWDAEKARLKGVPVRLDNGQTDIDILDATEYALIKYANYLLAGK